MTGKQKTQTAITALDSEFHLYPYIKYAIEEAGFKERQYVLPQSIYNKLKENRFDNQNIKELVENIAYFLGIPFMVKFAGVKVFKAPAADEVRRIGSYGNAGNIEMSLYEYHTAEQIVALAIHECAHAYLSFQGVSYSADTGKNEVFTEVAAVCLGFGQYLKEGYCTYIKETAVEEKNEIKLNRLSHKIGYISGGEIKEVIDEVECFKKVYKNL